MISHFFTRPRAEARLPRQPSTLAPSAHPRGAFIIVWKLRFHTIIKPETFSIISGFFHISV